MSDEAPPGPAPKPGPKPDPAAAPPPATQKPAAKPPEKPAAGPGASATPEAEARRAAASAAAARAGAASGAAAARPAAASGAGTGGAGVGGGTAAGGGRGAARFAWLLAVIAILALAGGGYFAWRHSQRPANDPAMAAIDQRLASLETRIASATEALTPDRSVEARLAAIEANRDELARRVEALVGQVGRAAQQLEAGRAQVQAQAPAAPSPELAQRLDALADEVRTLAGRIDGLRDEIAAPLDRRIAALEARPVPVLPDPQALLQLALDDLAARVETGKPFAAALRAVTALSRDEAAVNAATAGWGDRADKGIPTVEQLSARFDERADAAAGTERGEGWIDRAIDRASRLVSVRRVDPNLEGSTPEAIVGRAQARLEQHDLAAAVAELDGLPPAARERLGPWIADAQARLAADKGLAGLSGLTVNTATPAAKP